MKPEALNHIEKLHFHFTRETRMDLPLADNFIRDWYEWLKWSKKHCGRCWTDQDLLKVFSYIRKNHEMSWWPKMMKFSRLIQRPDVFAEDLAIARSRPQPRTNRTKVLAASGRPPQAPPDKARPAADVMREHKKMAELLKEWREDNFGATRQPDPIPSPPCSQKNGASGRQSRSTHS